MRVTPLFRDPVGWAESLGKSKLHVMFWSLVYISFTGIALFLLKDGLNTAGVVLMAMLAVVYPVLQLIAIYKLLKIVQRSRP